MLCRGICGPYLWCDSKSWLRGYRSSSNVSTCISDRISVQFPCICRPRARFWPERQPLMRPARRLEESVREPVKPLNCKTNLWMGSPRRAEWARALDLAQRAGPIWIGHPSPLGRCQYGSPYFAGLNVSMGWAHWPHGAIWARVNGPGQIVKPARGKRNQKGSQRFPR